jgi:hypothetical protein
MSSRLYIGSGKCDKALNLTEPTKTRDRTTSLYRCLSEKGEKVNVQFGSGIKTMVPARVISFASRRDPSKTDRMIMVNAEKNKTIASDLEAIQATVAKTLYDGRTMFWGGKPVSDLSFDDFMVGASKIVKTNNLNGEKQIGVKTRYANKIHPATRFFKIDEDEASGKKSTRKVVDFEGSGRNYEAVLACHLEVYTNYQSNRPTFGIYLTCTDCYLKDPIGGGMAAAATIAEGDCVSFDDVDSFDEIDESVVLTSTGDDIDVGQKRNANATGFTPSKRQTR